MQLNPLENLYATHPFNNQHKRIGLIFGSIASPFMATTMLGVSDYAQQHGYNIISFSGGPFANPEPDASDRAKIFEILQPSMFDGLIMTMGSLSRYVDAEQVTRFLAPYAHLPIVNIGSKIEGLTNLLVDNASGYRVLIRHLIQDHGYRRIAFFSGPISHISSNEKLSAYIEVLAEFDIPFNPEYVFYGHLTSSSLNCCVDIFLDERKLDIDAIVTVNDTQAFNTIQDLKQRGIRVPQDIAVTGCMGTAESFFYEPPLTTIKEPMYELGRVAAQTVIAQIEGNGARHDRVVPNAVIFRQSCGCKEQQLLPSDQAVPNALRQSMLSSAQHTQENTGISFNLDEMQHIALDFECAKSAADLNKALNQLETVLNHHIRGSEILAWLPTIPVIIQYLHKLKLTDAESVLPCLQRLESMFNQVVQKVFIFRNGQSEKYVNSFRQLSISLNLKFNPEDIKALLVRNIGISDFFVCVFEDKNDVAGLVRNVIAIRNKQLIALSDEEASFPAHQLIPKTIDTFHTPYNFVVLPMLFRSEAIGYIVMDVYDRNGVVYETLQSLLSGALKNEIQIQELKEAEKKFSDIAHSTSDWLWEIDKNCRYTYCSSGVENVLGYSAEEMLEHSLFDFVMPTEQDYIDTIKNQLVPEGKPINNLESVHFHKSGRRVVLIASGLPIMKNGVCIGYRGAFKDTTAIKEQENRIRQLAYHDSLTGLPNRTLFNDRLKMILAQAQRKEQSFAILFLDLDHFKQVNDTLGHEAGDILLKVVATRLAACTRDTDTLARLGGDEFTMILPNMEQIESVMTVAQRVVSALSAPIEVYGHSLLVTTSVGIACYPSDGQDAVTLLKNADKAMYKAKDQGKNRYAFYDAQIDG